METWDTFIDKIILLDEDRQELKEKRGFSDHMIETYKLRSCCPDNARVYEELKAQHKTHTVVPNIGLEGSHLNDQLTQRHILIPYLDKAGVAIKVRPHKLGFKKDPVRTFVTKTAWTRPMVCVIAESEFKAIASEALGFPAIGIPGISSVIGKGWQEFVRTLEQIGAQRYVVLFDHEVKDNPAYSNFKQDWRKRYDTIIYSYAMCQKLVEIGLSCTVAMLPEGWMVDGKIDIDGALAQGRTPLEYKRVIDSAVGPKKYLSDLPIPKIHQPFLTRRTNSFFFKTDLVERANQLYRVGIDKQGEKTERKIMNCVFKVKKTFLNWEDIGDAAIRRDMVIIDQYGVESHDIPIVSNNMVTRTALSAWLMGHGNFLFYGGDQDMIPLWEWVFCHDKGDIVYLMSRVGWLEDQNFFLFKNMMVKHYEAIYSDEDGIVWDDQVGYKPHSDSTNKDASMELPEIKSDVAFDLDEYLRYLTWTVDKDNPGRAKVLLAWVFAVMMCQAIFDHVKFFPILFFYGEKGSGKTTIMRWLTSFFGIYHQYRLEGTTAVGFDKAMEFYSNLPVIGDDWRDNDTCQKYVQKFLGIYNRQAGIKGTRGGKKIRMTPIRACLGVMGEEMIMDNGLQSRCISFFFTHERLKECGTDMAPIAANASAFTFDFLTNRAEEANKRIGPEIDKAMMLLQKKAVGSDQRTMYNYAVLLASWNVVMGEDEEVTKYIAALTADAYREISAKTKVHQFAEEFQYGVSQSIIPVSMYKYENQGKRLVLWVRGIDAAMSKYYGRKQSQIDMILRLLGKQDFFISAIRAEYPGASGSFPSIALDIQKMPDDIAQAFGSAYLSEEDREGMTEDDSRG